MDWKRTTIPAVLIHFSEQDNFPSKRNSTNNGDESDHSAKSPRNLRSPRRVSIERKSLTPVPTLTEGFSLFQSLFPPKIEGRKDWKSTVNNVYVETNRVTVRLKGDLSPRQPGNWAFTEAVNRLPPLATRTRKKHTPKIRVLDFDTPDGEPVLRSVVRQKTLSSLRPLPRSSLPTESITPTKSPCSPITRTYRQFPTF